MKARTKKRLHVDEESRALVANPEFRQALAEGKASAAAGDLTLEEINAEFGITAEEKAAAEIWLDELERRPEEPGKGPPTNGQGEAHRAGEARGR